MVIVIRKLGMVAVVRCDRMRLQMSMNGGVVMVGVGLVQVLGCKHRREGDGRSQNQADGGPAEGGRHAWVIIWRPLTANHQLPTPNSQLPTANSQLPTPNSQLPTANYQLPTTS